MSVAVCPRRRVGQREAGAGGQEGRGERCRCESTKRSHVVRFNATAQCGRSLRRDSLLSIEIVQVGRGPKHPQALRGRPHADFIGIRVEARFEIDRGFLHTDQQHEAWLA